MTEEMPEQLMYQHQTVNVIDLSEATGIRMADLLDAKRRMSKLDKIERTLRDQLYPRKPVRRALI